MNNQEIIKTIENDIKELNKKGYKFKIIKGLSTFGFFEVDLMVYIPQGLSGFYKSFRNIKFKSENARENFLKELNQTKTHI